MISASQLRAARGLLDWTRADLAKAANISPETIKNIEHGTFRPQEATTEAITRAFRLQGVAFTEQEGVKRHREVVENFTGREGFAQFMDDVYQTMSQGGQTMCVSGVSEKLFSEAMGRELIEQHVLRMNQIKDISARVLLSNEDDYLPGEKYIQYRVDADQSGGLVPFYVYGDKLAIIIFHADPSPQIVIVRSKIAVEAYKRQFDIIWERSKVLSK